jgi:sugar/nucleoside kinase (ribokinase family)
MSEALSESKQNDILCIGETVIDLISIDAGNSLDDVSTFTRYLGGAPINVAATAARMGRKAAVITRVGEDALGRFARSELQRLGIDNNGVQLDNRLPTTVALVARTTGSVEFLILRGADAALQATPEAQAAVKQVGAVHISLFALSREPGRSAVLQLLDAAYAAQRIISLDPTVRSGIWEDPAEIPKLLREVCPRATVIKPSLDDAAAIWGSGQTPQDYIAAFHNVGASNVLLTLGQAGVLASDGANITHIAAPNIQIADATGAGDSFAAGALLAMVDGASLAEAAAVGTTVAAHKLQAVGNLATMPDWATVLRQTESIPDSAVHTSNHFEH